MYLDGKPDHKLQQGNLVEQLEKEIRAKAETKKAQLDTEQQDIIAKELEKGKSFGDIQMKIQSIRE